MFVLEERQEGGVPFITYPTENYREANEERQERRCKKSLLFFVLTVLEVVFIEFEISTCPIYHLKTYEMSILQRILHQNMLL
jgi:hypothetical protein